MSSVNPIPIETSVNQCIKCSKLISENQSSIQCEICMLNTHTTCLRNKQSNLNNILFTCDKCSHCSVCFKRVANNHKAILCDCCNSFVHIKCNKLSADDYEKHKNDPNLDFTCLQCNHSMFPFMSLNNQQFSMFAKNGVILNDDSELELIPSSEQKAFMDKVTSKIRSYRLEMNDDDNDDLEEMTDCKYYTIDDFKKENFSNSNSFSILHLNAHSIERHFDEIQVTLNLLKFQFDILCFSESKIIDGIGPKTNIMLDGYQELVGMHTKATKGGVLIYVKNGINFVPRNDLIIEKEKKLESCFIEIQNTNRQNSIVGI